MVVSDTVAASASAPRDGTHEDNGGAPGWRVLVRAALFALCALVVCPVRIWGPIGGVDSTWVFALNWAAAHGLAFGRDVVFTSGPLAWLSFPQPVGDNLARGVLFQSFVWVVLAGVLADLFFRSGVSLRNLALFTAMLALSAPLYWFDYIGLPNLLIAAAAVLLTNFRLRGERWRYAGALVIMGIVPLLKLTGGMVAAGLLAGFLVDHAIRLRSRAAKDILAGLLIPPAVFLASCWLLFPSAGAIARYIKESLDLASGYSSAMSLAGDRFAFGAALEVSLVLGGFLITGVRGEMRRFLVALFALPLFLSFKHGFVRQDMHELNFFCFVALALALSALALNADRRRIGLPLILLFGYGLIWLEYMNAQGDPDALREATGISSAQMLSSAVHLDQSREELVAQSGRSCDVLARTDPAIRAMIGQAPVASLSAIYDGAGVDGLNLQLYPVIQRYSAYTPCLDHLNAAWIRDKGPRFLVSDFVSIDGRQPWMETPAMWYETLRWYDLRLLGKGHVLLERRQAPRFSGLRVTRHFPVPFDARVELPPAGQAEFWSATCGMSASGAVRKLLFRVPEVIATLSGTSPPGARARVIPEVLSSPVPVRLPSTLAELASMFSSGNPPPRVQAFSFGGPGAGSYGSCEVEFLHTVP